jgi:VCBS repeat-containing protein
METIPTLWGMLSFAPSTGSYTFIPSGILQEGESHTLNIQIRVALTTDGQVQDSGWHDYPLELQGINNAPVLPALLESQAGVAYDGASGWQALNWTDVDNSLTEQSGKFHIDVWSDKTGDAGTIIGAQETVRGEYGDLTMNSDQGIYQYTLHADAFVGGEHRVVDEFMVTVTDPGSDGAGANAATSDPAGLFVFGVDGGIITGSDGGETLSLPGSSDKAFVFNAGGGNDTIDLTNTSHENVLVWNKSDVAAGETARDVVIDFHGRSTDDPEDLGDILDLRSLLDGQDTECISFKVEGEDVIISIETVRDASVATQNIVLADAATNLGMNAIPEGDYEELAKHIFLLTNASS